MPHHSIDPSSRRSRAPWSGESFVAPLDDLDIPKLTPLDDLKIQNSELESGERRPDISGLLSPLEGALEW